MGSDDSEAGDDDVDMEEKNECEYGDLEAAPEDADTSDYGVPQFTAKDEVRDPMGSKDSESGDDDGDMEEENECECGDLEAASEDANTSDYGVHQFIAKDEARDPMCSDGSEAGDDDGDMEEEHKYEYGDLGAASEDADTSDMASTSSSARPSRLWGCRHLRLRRPPVHR